MKRGWGKSQDEVPGANVQFLRIVESGGKIIQKIFRNWRKLGN